VSGKGGTGKTSLVASFAALARDVVIADCDVDAADLHLILSPSTTRGRAFFGGQLASVRADRCNACGECERVCRRDAIRALPGGPAVSTFRVDVIACDGCGACGIVCPTAAIDFADRVAGEWFESETRFGPFVHARLGIAQENSGKLVALVRKEARRVARERGKSLLLVDASPGIGCPVISSLTAADLALVVTEPTRAALHDLDRVVSLASRMSIPAAVCINKWDLCPAVAREIETRIEGRGIPMVGRVPYDIGVTESQLAGQAIVEGPDGAVSDAVRGVWERVSPLLPA
jgi:MinD superfamily P-loop ATPase